MISSQTRTHFHPAIVRPRPPLASPARSSNRRAWMLSVAILIAGAALVGWPGPAHDVSPELQQRVTRSLSQDEPASSGRLLRTSMTAQGDVEIEFVLLEHGDAGVNRTAALADVVSIVRAVYEAPGPRPITVTLLGVARLAPTADPVPVLYASLPADRLVGQDWTQLQPGDLDGFGVVRWLPAGQCKAWGECETAVSHRGV